MNQPNCLTAKRQLADAIANGERRTPWPLNVSPWIAMALLQKAIRRGHEGLALQAAATLLENSPERLWRRCGGIAFEDIGLADLDTVAVVTATLAGKRLRAQLGGEWPVASCIVAMMAGAAKCRATDDLLMSAELYPGYALMRDQLGLAKTQHLLETAVGVGTLPERAIAIWYATGTDRRHSRHLRARRGDPNAVFDLLRNSGYPPVLVCAAREGYRKIGEVLAPFVVLLSGQVAAGVREYADDPIPPDIMIRDVPGWAFDMYSREGRAALGAFLRTGSKTARWVRAHIPPSQQVSFLGGVVFRVEGGLVRRRLKWALADDLRRLVDIECQGRHCPDATEVLQLMRADIPLLNKVRGHVC